MSDVELESLGIVLTARERDLLRWRARRSRKSLRSWLRLAVGLPEQPDDAAAATRLTSYTEDADESGSGNATDS